MSSIKKNILAAALVAGLGLAGTAAAYNYGTLSRTSTIVAPDDTGTSTSNSLLVQADLDKPEVVSYEMLLATNYAWTMQEDLVFDIQIPDNAVQVTTGYTVRVKLNRTSCMDDPNVQYPSGANICQEDLANTDTRFGAAPVPADLILDASLALAGWTVAFDGFYDGNRTASFRIIPTVSNPPNPGPGIMLRWRNARLTGLAQFAEKAHDGGDAIVNAEFWMVNATNDSRFAGSTKNRPILQSSRAVVACATPSPAEVDKYIDVADHWLEDQIPKTRFSWDGKLGSADDANTVAAFQLPLGSDYDAQVIDLGDVTLSTGALIGTGSFTYWGNGNPGNSVTDVFQTVIQAGAGNNWDAFDNPLTADDDVFLVNGSCATGTIIDRGVVSGSTVTFNYSAQEIENAQAGFINVGGATRNLTVCGYVDTDTIIDDHNNVVTTTFYRVGMYPANGSAPGDTGTAYPTSGYASGVGSKTMADPTCTLLPLRYNGSTLEIFTINPGTNTAQRSFIRLTNRSATDGWVSLEGIQDNGTRTTGGAPDRSQVRIWIEAGKSVQVYADQLESGVFPAGLTAAGAWGSSTPGNKWRAVVTAEFPGLVATSLISNESLRVLTNITDSDTRGEQYGRDYVVGTFACDVGERPSVFGQDVTPDFHGNGDYTGEPGGPDANDGPAGGQTTPDGNPGL